VPAPRTTAAKAPSKTPNFDLTTLEGVEPDEPLVVRIAQGKVVRLKNVRDLDWKIVAGLTPERPHEFLRNVLIDEDYDVFMETPLTDKQLEPMLRFYLDFFELNPGESGA
jgi:hypothetical protein